MTMCILGSTILGGVVGIAVSYFAGILRLGPEVDDCCLSQNVDGWQVGFELRVIKPCTQYKHHDAWGIKSSV